MIGHMGLFFYNKIGSIISIVDLPTTNIIEPEKLSSFSLQIFKKGGDLAWTLNIFITEKRKDLTS
ncbi:hypothetical protein [Streptococcus pneumoniae]|uniref:hypothetical protein n=1 Tax=Streptococcus pneumoniae TaxID=1313 RepID=UPI0039A4F751